MRFSEFKLLEATLQRTSTTSWPGYLENLVKSTDIGLGPQGERGAGLELNDKSKTMLKSIIKKIEKAGGKLDIETARAIEEMEVTFTNGQKSPIKYIHKSAEIKGGTNASGTEKKPWNEGEVAETILGAALYARFISRTDVSEKDVWDALRVFTNNVIPGGFRVSGTKRNKKSPIDMTAINKPLNNQVIDSLIHKRAEISKQFPEGIQALEDKIAACANYVNESNKVLKALEEADANPGAPITIKTDGVGDQKGTKADLQIEIGQWKQLLSLKVNDIKQFGQESGSSGAVVTSFFQRFIPDLDLSGLYMSNGEPIPWTPESGEGWPDMDNKKAVKQLKLDNLWDAALDQVYKLTGMAYQKAAAHLQEKLTTPEGSADVVTNLYNGIIHHVQGNAQFQTLVILNPSAKVAWKELEFGPSLAQALGHYTLSVDVEVGQRGGGNHKLRIYGTPATPESQVAAHTKITSKADAVKAKKKADAGQIEGATGKQLLFQLRSYQQESGNMRNPVEMGPLLKDLTEVQKIEDLPDETSIEQTAQVPQATQGQPATTNSATAPASETPPAEEPAPQGVPSGMQTIEPAPQAGSTQEEPTDYKELNRIKKNAGISVE
jgi:hypothetical protein